MTKTSTSKTTPLEYSPTTGNPKPNKLIEDMIFEALDQPNDVQKSIEEEIDKSIDRPKQQKEYTAQDIMAEIDAITAIENYVEAESQEQRKDEGNGATNEPAQQPEAKPIGRPKKHSGPTRRLTVDLPANLHKGLKQLALDQEVTMTEIVTSIVKGAMQARK